MQHRNNVDSVNKQLNRHKNMLLFTVWGDRGRGARDPFLYHGKLSGARPQMSSRRAQADPEGPQDDS